VRELHARLVAIPFALVLMSAVPADQVIALPGLEGEAIVIPHNSPVHFRGWGENDVAHFSGKFVLAGTYSYGCEFCDDWPIKTDELSLKIVPDAAMASRLPHWRLRSGNKGIFIDASKSLNRTIGTPDELRALKAGKIDDIHGNVSVLVDHFDAAIECDGAAYSARLVAVIKRPTVRRNNLDGSYGCG
jgi:hypothetical protein